MPITAKRLLKPNANLYKCILWILCICKKKIEFYTYVFYAFHICNNDEEDFMHAQKHKMYAKNFFIFPQSLLKLRSIKSML